MFNINDTKIKHEIIIKSLSKAKIIFSLFSQQELLTKTTFQLLIICLKIWKN